MDPKPLVKVPLLLLTTTCLHVAFRSPNPRVMRKAGAVVVSFGEISIRFMSATVPVFRHLLWSATLAEAAAVIARAYPSLPISNILLSATHFEGRDGRNMRFTTIRLIACLLAIAGSGIRMWCYRELGKHFTFELGLQKDHKLITTGPYSIVRHPSYTAAILNNIALIGLYGTRGSWLRESGVLETPMGKLAVAIELSFVAAISVALLKRIKEEDGVLRKQFGNQWDAWAAKVPYVLLPGVI